MELAWPLGHSPIPERSDGQNYGPQAASSPPSDFMRPSKNLFEEKNFSVTFVF